MARLRTIKFICGGVNPPTSLLIYIKVTLLFIGDTMVKKITRAEWRKYQKHDSPYVRTAWNRNGKRYINQNNKAVEVEVTGMRKLTKR